MSEATKTGRSLGLAAVMRVRQSCVFCKGGRRYCRRGQAQPTHSTATACIAANVGCPTRRDFRRVGTTNPDGLRSRPIGLQLVMRCFAPALWISVLDWSALVRVCPWRSGDSCSRSTVRAITKR